MECCETHEEHKSQRHESGKKQEEHHHEESGHHTRGNLRINKQYIFLAIIGIILLFSVVQAVQLSSARIDIAVAQATGGTPVTNNQRASTPTASAPTMVGGC